MLSTADCCTLITMPEALESPGFGFACYPFLCPDFNHRLALRAPHRYLGDEDCACFGEWRQDGHWDDCGGPASCDAAYSFLCRLPASAPPQAPLLTACPSGWLRHGRKCYKLEGSASQAGCQERCATALPPPSPSAGLVCVEDANEQRFIEEHFGSLASCCHWPSDGDIRPISHVAHGSVSIKTLPLIAAAQAIFKEAGTTGGLLGAAQRIGTGPWASRTSLLIWRRIVCC